MLGNTLIIGERLNRGKSLRGIKITGNPRADIYMYKSTLSKLDLSIHQ